MLKRTRREILKAAGCGFGYVAMSALAHSEAVADDRFVDPQAAKQPHFHARARNVIFLYMQGGVSHLDTFDYRPELARQQGNPLPTSLNQGRTLINGNLGHIMASPWRFRQHGNSGAWVSDLFPQLGAVADELCFIKSMHGTNNVHVPATLDLHTGVPLAVRPSIGSWVTYGLGSENNNLPGFIAICPSMQPPGQRSYGSGFLPAAYQAELYGTSRSGISNAQFENISNHEMSRDEQRRLLDLIKAGNDEQLSKTGPDDNLESRIASFELAYRMQSEAPDATDIADETKETHRLYGLEENETRAYGHQLLLARRFVERGVRFVHVPHTGATANSWDQHSNLISGHSKNARSCDRPIAGLIRDLRQRGLLHETLVVWCTEFGRTPEVQHGSGRDHHHQAFTFWLAGGGIRPGMNYGATDDFGYHAVERPVQFRDLHATVLHLLGLDHTRLTYRHSGRDFRLTDVGGTVLNDIIS